MVYIYLTNKIKMKRLLFLIFTFQSILIYAQSPAPYINYQGVARSVNGDPLTGNIGVEIIIKQGSLSGSVALSEHYTVPTNTFGIFNLKIGSDQSASFALIDWSNGPYYLIVGIDPLGGSNYVVASQQQLVSVPYAMYAKEAKNVRNYVAGNNVTIVPPSSGIDYTINAAGGNSGGVDTLVVLPLNHSVNSVGYKHTITIASPTLNSSSDIITVLNAFPNYNLSYKTPSLSLSSGSVLSIQQGTYTSPSITLTSGAPAQTWTINSGNIVQVNNSALVGIGLPNPTAKLDITGNTSNIINATTTGGGNVVNAVTTGAGNGLFSTAATGAALIGINSSGIGAAIQANNNGVAESFYAYKTNAQTGTVAKFENLSNSNGSPIMVVNSNTTNVGISVNVGQSNAIVANSNGGTPSIYATNTGAGSALEGNNTGNGTSIRGSKVSGNGSSGVFDNLSTSNTSPVLFVNNASTAGGTAINVTHTTGVGINVSTSGPGNVMNVSTTGGGIGVNVSSAGNSAINAVSSSTTAATILANNSGGTGIQGNTSSSSSFAYGVYGRNTGAGSGVFGETSSIAGGFNAGVYGLSTGDLPAMLARNMWGSNSLAASGIRAMTNSSHAQAAGVHGENLGAGPAVKASLATTVSAGSNNVALIMEHGHIKSIGTAPTITTVSATGIAPGPTLTSSINATSTDVKGNVAISFNVAANSVFNGGSMDLVVQFNKPYTTGSVPIVMLTPTTDLLGMDYRVVSVSNTGFTIKVYKPNNSVVAEPASLPLTGAFGFNYFVIE